MISSVFRFLPLVIIILWMGSGCANITAPAGGNRDTIPPRLVSIVPADSLLNTKVNRIELHFDEYITVSDPIKEVTLSPMLSIQPTVTGLNKHVIVKIPDSLLEKNTTYTLSFGNAIKDIHEGNAFRAYTYVFSTGPYFDSLQLHGIIINAETGLRDSSGVIVELYNAAENDTVVVQHKPKYVTKSDGTGTFVFKGLPKRLFRVYAIKDANGNYMYDGAVAGEQIAFSDTSVIAGDTTGLPVALKIFAEIPDTSDKKKSTFKTKESRSGMKPKVSEGLTYSVNIDTSNAEKRSFDINHTIDVTFNKAPILNTDKVILAYDSAGITVNSDLSLRLDSVPSHVLHISVPWSENMLYSLRLAKGFAKDTSGADVMPGRFAFRTMEEGDYGKLKIILPGKYLEKFKNDQLHVPDSVINDTLHKRRFRNPNAEYPGYVLKVLADNDSVYQKPITDSVVALSRLRPGRYTFRVIVDKNGNGLWDTGDLLEKIQPEEVIPYPHPIILRAGFEQIFDFEEKPPAKKITKEKPAKVK